MEPKFRLGQSTFTICLIKQRETRIDLLEEYAKTRSFCVENSRRFAIVTIVIHVSTCNVCR